MLPVISLMLAVGRDGLLGVHNRLPWHCPEDMKFFRETTTGHPIIYGRKTSESFGGRVLLHRPNIVLTRDPGYAFGLGVHVAHNVNSALHMAQKFAVDMGVKEVFVIGGSEVYQAMWDKAAHIYLTQVDFASDDPAATRLPAHLLAELEGDKWECEGGYLLTNETSPVQASVRRFVRVLDPGVDYQSTLTFGAPYEAAQDPVAQ